MLVQISTRALHIERRWVLLAGVVLALVLGLAVALYASAVRSCGTLGSTIDRTFGIEEREIVALREPLATFFPGSRVLTLSGNDLLVGASVGAPLSQTSAHELLERWTAVYLSAHGALPHSSTVALTVLNGRTAIQSGCTGCSPWP